MGWSYIYQTDKKTAYQASKVLFIVIGMILIIGFIRQMINSDNSTIQIYTVGKISRTHSINNTFKYHLVFEPFPSRPIDTIVISSRSIEMEYVFVRCLRENPTAFSILLDTIPVRNLTYGKYWNFLEPKIYEVKKY